MCSFYCVLLQSQVAFYFYGYCYHLFQLVSVAKTTSDTKAASYNIIATTLREKIHVPKEQFKAYFLALLADKEYTRIFDTIAKVEKSFRRPTPYFRTQARGNLRSSPYPRERAIGAEPPATSLHNVGREFRRPATFLLATQVTITPTGLSVI